MYCPSVEMIYSSSHNDLRREAAKFPALPPVFGLSIFKVLPSTLMLPVVMLPVLICIISVFGLLYSFFIVVLIV